MKFWKTILFVAIISVATMAAAQEQVRVPLAFRCNITGEADVEKAFCEQLHAQAFRTFGVDAEGAELWFQVDLIARDTGCGVAANIMVLVAYPEKFGQLYMAVAQHISVVTYEELKDEEVFEIKWAAIQDGMAVWSRGFGPFVGWLPPSGRVWMESQ